MRYGNDVFVLDNAALRKARFLLPANRGGSRA